MRAKQKIVLPVLFIASLLLSILAQNIALSGTTGLLVVDPANNTGDVNEDFAINIGISDIGADSSLYAWETHIRYNPAVLGVVHTRYFRSDRSLLTAQSGLDDSITASYAGMKLFCQLGIRVWRRDVSEVETEITSGTPVSIATQMVGSAGMVSGASWTCPSESFQPTDAIKVEVYARFCMTPAGGLPTAWTLVDNWMTDRHPIVAALDGAKWAVYYYIEAYLSAGKIYGEFFFDNTTYNSRIEISGISRGTFLSDAAGSQGWSAVFLQEIDEASGVVRLSEYIDPKTTDPKYPPVGAIGSGVLVSIKFFIIGEGVTLLHFDFTELFTVISGTPVNVNYKTTDGLFDNRGVILPPQAVFTAPLYGIETLDVVFDGSASNDAADGGWITSYEWDFDYDGMTFDVDATGKVAVHAFDLAGTYTVALRVTDNDGLDAIASEDITIQIWMVGGWFPDLIGKQAWPESPKWYESKSGREPEFYARIGNPTEDEYEVYAEFAIFSKDEAKKLGVIQSPIITIAAGETLDESAVMDLTSLMWRAFSGSPNPASWNWLGYYAAYCRAGDPFAMRKYIVFASCYYKNSSMSEFEQGYIVKYFHFNVIPAEHDIGVVSVATDPQGEVPQGSLVTVDVNVTNYGELEETFDVTTLYKGAVATGTIGVQTITLQPGQSVIVTFTWDTDALPIGPYIIRGRLSILTFEWPIDIASNQEAFTVAYVV